MGAGTTRGKGKGRTKNLGRKMWAERWGGTLSDEKDLLSRFLFGGCFNMGSMKEMDEWQLLEEYARNDSEEAFRTIVDRYAGFVYHTAFRQAGNPHIAEEVTQAVFIALAQKA